MHIAHTPAAHRVTRRAAYAALAALLLAVSVADILRGGAGWWQFFAFGAAPDVAVLLGIGASLEKGQLHPRAVRLYNALHSFWGPVALAVATVALPSVYLAGALVWALHISFDRTVGYGMRTPDGFQRS